MSLYERTATDDDNNELSAEDRTIFDFYSSPLDKNGIRVSLDKVSIFHHHVQNITFRKSQYYINHTNMFISLPNKDQYTTSNH